MGMKRCVNAGVGGGARAGAQARAQTRRVDMGTRTDRFKLARAAVDLCYPRVAIGVNDEVDTEQFEARPLHLHHKLALHPLQHPRDLNPELWIP